MDFTDPALFGAHPQERIVAVEFDGTATALVYVRGGDGGVRVEAHPFRPFAWAPAGGPGAIPLAGGHPLGWRWEFADWKALTAARADPAFAGAFWFSDPVQQFLSLTGRTLFLGMTFESLRRLQLHVELTRAEGSPHADPARDPLAGIAVTGSDGWEEHLPIAPGEPASERAALERLGAIVAERDPDVIEGHHLFKLALPFLAARAKAHKLRLRWGRDGGPLTTRASRLQIAEKTIQYLRPAAAGRHFVDTHVLAHYYDVGTRELEGFSLPEVAAHFGLAQPGPGPLARARETRALAATLSASAFIQAQIFPYNYQDVIVRGNATKIDALFLREYLRLGHSVPATPEARAFEGGYTDVFFTGVARGVWHCDVASLYPSVMLAFGLLPASDTLGVFAGLLRALRTFRYEAKRRMRAAEAAPGREGSEIERRHYSALQNTFKILINSFYGYLGFAQGHFADYDAAAAVTAKGRELLRAMVAWLQAAGAHVIEIDTDGIYFQPPAGATLAALDAGLRAQLPEGIEVEFDAQYAAMFSYRAKNYALLAPDGRITLKGAALKSRGMEPYLRDYLSRAVAHILHGQPAELATLRTQLETAIRSRAWGIDRLAKTETLQDSPAAYARKITTSSRNRNAAFELALASGRDYQAGDALTYYVTGTKKKVVAYEAARLAETWDPAARDENVEYYVAKLNELHAKFAPFAPFAPFAAPPPPADSPGAQGMLW